MKHKHDSSRLAGAQGALYLLPLLGLLCGLVSCQKPFDVNVNAADPIKVDVTMDVHVYQHGGAAVKKTKDKDIEAADYKEVVERRRDRMGDIQTMKDDRIIGENHKGLLSVLIKEGDTRNWPLEYVRETVGDENQDRTFLIEHEASRDKEKTVSDVQREQWEQKQRKSHPGEWIETVDPNSPDIYVWIQKRSPNR